MKRFQSFSWLIHGRVFFKKRLMVVATSILFICLILFPFFLLLQSLQNVHIRGALVDQSSLKLPQFCSFFSFSFFFELSFFLLHSKHNLDLFVAIALSATLFTHEVFIGFPGRLDQNISGRFCIVLEQLESRLDLTDYLLIVF